MKTRGLIWIVLTIAGLSLTSGMLNAQGPQGEKGGKGNCLIQCLNSLPGITDEQKNQLFQLQISFKQEMNVLREQSFNVATPQQRIDLATQIATKREDHRAKINGVLTPEQQKVFDEMMQNRKNQMKEKRQKRQHNCNCGNNPPEANVN